MAARLNTPADFLTTRTSVPGQAPDHGLLPPSTFSVPQHRVQADTLKELAEATSKVLDLQEQNRKLRASKHVTFTPSEEIRARVAIHHQEPEVAQPRADSARAGFAHFDDIIQRQAGEISSLRQKLIDLELEHQKSETRWESRQTLEEVKHQQQVAALQSEVEVSRGRHQEEVRRFQEESSRELSNQRSTILHLEEQLQASQSEHRQQVSELESVLHDLRSESDQAVKEREKSLVEKTAELAEARREVAQLKTYFAETESTSKATETWKREVDNINTKLKHKEEDNTQLQNQVELLSMRLRSQDKILLLQEEGLAKVKDESGEKKKNALVTQWREKVYALMLQAKAAELSHKQEEHNWRLKFEDIQDQLLAVQHHGDVQTAALEDKDTQLNMVHNQVMGLQSELTRAQDIALSLDDQLADQTKLTYNLAQFAQQTWDRFEETAQAYARLQTILNAFNQRISFAAGRVNLLQSQFSRKEAILRLKFEEALRERPTHDPDSAPPPQRDKDDVRGDAETLTEELQRLTAERDQMARQLQEDADLLESRLAGSRQQYEEKVEALGRRLAEVQESIEAEQQAMAILQDKYERSECEKNEVFEELEKTRTDLARSQLQASTEAEARLVVEQAQFTEQLAEMERRVNEARREHAKAVVSLRQQERSTAREQERAAEHLADLERHHRDVVARLEQKLMSSEKDRNMLMTTLRQEGLVGKHRLQRAPPAQLPDEGHDEGMYQPKATTIETQSDSEPLHAVIDDLKTLTADVMGDSSDVGES